MPHTSRMEVRYGLTDAHRAILARLEKAQTLTPYDVGTIAALAQHAIGADRERVDALRVRLAEAKQ